MPTGFWHHSRHSLPSTNKLAAECEVKLKCPSTQHTSRQEYPTVRTYFLVNRSIQWRSNNLFKSKGQVLICTFRLKAMLEMSNSRVATNSLYTSAQSIMGEPFNPPWGRTLKVLMLTKKFENLIVVKIVCANQKLEQKFQKFRICHARFLSSV